MSKPETANDPRRRFEKILVPTDFSDSARRAFDAACELARTTNGNVTLFHVVQSPPPIATVMTTGFVGDLDLDRLLHEEAARALEKWATAARAVGECRVEIARSAGQPWHEIVELATRGAYDLIVVGTHGRTGIRRVLLGSVAERVARHATIPVLIVR